MRSTISILGLWNWDKTIFDVMSLPAGIDRPTLIANLITELAELEVLYSDAGFMKNAIRQWSKKELPTWERIAKAAAAEYDPIENYDRHEEWNDSAEATVVGYNDPTQTPTGGSTGSHKGRIHGNVGVTTSQQMLVQEIDISPRLNVYNYIIDSFRKRFCLLVY